MTPTDIYIVSAKRTAIGTFGGSLKDVPLSQLATTAVRAAVEASGAPLDGFGHVVMGNVIPTEPADAYLSRYAAIQAGLGAAVPAFNVTACAARGCRRSSRRRRRCGTATRRSRSVPAPSACRADPTSPPRRAGASAWAT